MKCAIFFALVAFTSATPLMGWRNVETNGPREFWDSRDAVSHENDRAQVDRTREAIQQWKQYPHTWTEVPEQSRISPMHMRSQEFPEKQTYQAYQHPYSMPMRAHEIPLEQRSHESPAEQAQKYEWLIRMHEIPFARTPETAKYSSQMPMTHLPSLEQRYQGEPMQYFYSRLQKFEEEHSEQEVQSLIVRLQQWSQELHHQQEVVDQQLSHVESRLMFLHQQAQTEAYQQWQQVHHQLQLQKDQLIRQQLAHRLAVEHLQGALVRKQQRGFDTHEEVGRPSWQRTWWY